jgi:cytoskeletal protein CcmA (bactofilin family)
MDFTKNGDLKISGSGSTGGGIFNTFSISGSGKVNGDVECNNFSISGSGRVTGSIHATDGKVSGSAHITGNIECSDTMKISGSTNVGGNMKCVNLNVKGGANIGGNLSAEHIQTEGYLKVNGDCSAENFNSDGYFYIDGLLNAGNIELRLNPLKSRACNIGGEKIKVTRSFSHAVSSFLKSIVTGNGFLLETCTIEGDEISLEATKADVVRGVDIKIGSGCEIGLVEYSGTFKQANGAVVKENKKI